MRRLCASRVVPLVLLTVALVAGPAVAEVTQTRAASAAPAVAAEPGPPVPLPSKQPWIEAPQGQPGTPVTPAPSPPPPGTLSGPGKVCQGKTRLKTHGLNPKPEIWCEVSPGKWVKVDPDQVQPIPGQKVCPGRQRPVTAPGMPMPDLQCETSPGKWEQDPASPYRNAGKGGQHCSFSDIPCMAKQAVNEWFVDLVKSAKKPVLDFLAATVLGTPEIHSSDMRRVRELWGVSQVIANTCFVLIISAAGVLLMAGQSLPGELSPKELLPRLVLGFLAANLSLTLIDYGIQFANGLAAAFLTGGPEKMNAHVLADTLAGTMLANIASGGTLLVLLALVVIVLAVCVAFIYVARLAITMVLAAAAPLALMFHALPMTDGLARFWWRGMSGILAIQVLQSLTLVTAFHLLFTETKDTSGSFLGIPTKNDLTDLLVAICLLWVMIRIPSWVARTIWRPAQPRMLGQLAKSFLIYRGIGALLNRARVARGASRVGRLPLKPSHQRIQPSGSGRPRPTTTPPPGPAGSQPPPPPPGPTPAQPPPRAGGEPGKDEAAGRPVQLELPIQVPPKPGKSRPVQLSLPVPVTRVARRPAPAREASLPRPRARSRQLMFSGMPKRPVPHRQLLLFRDPPKQNRRKS